jgi:hypothetical protein
MNLHWESLTEMERRVLRERCFESFEVFIQCYFYWVQGQRFIWNWHHTYVCEELQGVVEGRCARLILNCPPGATKTEIFSIHLAAWCIARSIHMNRIAQAAGVNELPGHSTRWLPVSYSDDLVRENTSRVRDILMSEQFQWMWEVTASADTNQKHNWEFYDEFGNRHAMYGTSLNGQVMGRRAGFMEEGFTGIALIDDPLPSKDDGYFNQINKSNKRLNRVMRSRLAHDRVPIVMMQQRISKGDSTDYLMGPKSPDTWRRVKVPAVIDREYVDNLPAHIRRECIADTGFKSKPVSYWEWKEPLASLLTMKKADPYLYSSQYQQEPDEAQLAGLIFGKEIAQLVAQGRALSFIPVEPSLPVDTYWDLGMDDDMSIWLVQRFGMEIRLVAFYKNHDAGMEHYINWLHDFRDMFGIRFGVHYGPHDLEVRELTTGKSRKDTAKRMGIAIITKERPRLKRDAIEPMRPLFNRIWVDTTRCETDCLLGYNGRDSEATWEEGRGGWSALKKYHREYDEEREVFKPEPAHDWASHPTDALLNLGLTDKSLKPKSGQDMGEDTFTPAGRGRQLQTTPPGRAGSWQGS